MKISETLGDVLDDYLLESDTLHDESEDEYTSGLKAAIRIVEKWEEKIRLEIKLIEERLEEVDLPPTYRAKCYARKLGLLQSLGEMPFFEQ